MENLKITPKVIYEAKPRDFEALVAKTFPQAEEYEMVPDLEIGNYSCFRAVVREHSMSFWDKEKMEKFRAGESVSGMTHLLLAYFVNEGIIPEGEYLFDTSW